MINVRFRTNVDAKHVSWYFPTSLACRPMKGDLVKSTNDDQTLEVSSITHCESVETNNSPYLEVWLRKITHD